MDQLQVTDIERLHSLHTYMIAFKDKFKTLLDHISKSHVSIAEAIGKLNTDAQISAYVKHMVDNYGETEPYVPFEYGIPCDANDLLPQNFEECFFLKYLHYDWDAEAKRRLSSLPAQNQFIGGENIPGDPQPAPSVPETKSPSNKQTQLLVPVQAKSAESDAGQFCQALYDLDQEPDWLVIYAGEVLRVVEAPDGETGDDWVYVEKEDRTCGYVPLNFISFDT